MPLKFSEGLLSGLRNYGRMPEPDPSIVRRPGGMLTPAPQYAPAQTIAKGIGGMFGVDMRTDEQKRAERMKKEVGTGTLEGQLRAIDIALEDSTLSSSQITDLGNRKRIIQSDILTREAAKNARLKAEDKEAKDASATITMANELREAGFEQEAEDFESGIYDLNDMQTQFRTLRNGQRAAAKGRKARIQYIHDMGLDETEWGKKVLSGEIAIEDYDPTSFSRATEAQSSIQKSDKLVETYTKEGYKDTARLLEKGMITTSQAQNWVSTMQDKRLTVKDERLWILEDSGAVVVGATITDRADRGRGDYIGYYDVKTRKWLDMPEGAATEIPKSGDLTGVQRTLTEEYVRSHGRENKNYTDLSAEQEVIFRVDVALRAKELQRQNGTPFDEELRQAMAEALGRIEPAKEAEPIPFAGAVVTPSRYTPLHSFKAPAKGGTKSKKAGGKPTAVNDADLEDTGETDKSGNTIYLNTKTGERMIMADGGNP